MVFDNANLITSINGYLFKLMATKQSRLTGMGYSIMPMYPMYGQYGMQPGMIGTGYGMNPGMQFQRPQ